MVKPSSCLLLLAFSAAVIHGRPVDHRGGNDDRDNDHTKGNDNKPTEQEKLQSSNHLCSIIGGLAIGQQLCPQAGQIASPNPSGEGGRVASPGSPPGSAPPKDQAGTMTGLFSPLPPAKVNSAGGQTAQAGPVMDIGQGLSQGFIPTMARAQSGSGSGNPDGTLTQPFGALLQENGNSAGGQTAQAGPVVGNGQGTSQGFLPGRRGITALSQSGLGNPAGTLN